MSRRRSSRQRTHALVPADRRGGARPGRPGATRPRRVPRHHRSTPGGRAHAAPSAAARQRAGASDRRRLHARPPLAVHVPESRGAAAVGAFARGAAGPAHHRRVSRRGRRRLFRALPARARREQGGAGGGVLRAAGPVGTAEYLSIRRRGGRERARRHGAGARPRAVAPLPAAKSWPGCTNCASSPMDCCRWRAWRVPARAANPSTCRHWR